MDNQNITDPISLSETELGALVEKKATCPFIGTAVMTKELPIRNSVNQPLASIEDVVTLGNSGGGDLGKVLKVFAMNNHKFMPDDAGNLTAKVPSNHFSLDFPGSKGSHPGHSGILQSIPTVLSSGRFSPQDFKRLTDKATDGWITLSAVGKFIAENTVMDSKSKLADLDLLPLILQEVTEIISQGGQIFLEKVDFFGARTDVLSPEENELREKLCKVTGGKNNLVGSAGEFGLLFAFFANKPDAPKGTEPTLSVEDLTLMFERKQFPSGWETWKKEASTWVTSTVHLAASTVKEFENLKNG